MAKKLNESELKKLKLEALNELPAKDWQQVDVQVAVVEAKTKWLREITRSIFTLLLVSLIIVLFAHSAYSSKGPLFTGGEILPVLTGIIGALIGFYLARGRVDEPGKK